MDVFHKIISSQPRIIDHSYLDHRYPEGLTFIPWHETLGDWARGQNLEHLKHCGVVLYASFDVFIS